MKLSAYSTGRDNNFNLVRFLAAFTVLWSHSYALTVGPGAEPWVRWIGYTPAGIAVDAFFITSGFLVTASLLRLDDFKAFVRARALRIFPALIACVALSVFVLGPMVTTSTGYWSSAETWRYLWSNATLWRAEYALPGVFDTLPRTAVNGSLWTLPIEVRLYLALLVASLCGVLTAKRYVLPWLLALAGAACFAWWRAPLPAWLANDLWCVAFFITGTALWLVRDRVRLSWVGVVALLALAAATRGTPWFAAAYFALVCYGTLWLAFVRRGPPATHHDLSYGLYLYGWPAAQLVQLYSPGAPLHNLAWASVCALALAALSWFLVERPALRLKRAFGTKTPVASPAAAGA